MHSHRILRVRSGPRRRACQRRGPPASPRHPSAGGCGRQSRRSADMKTLGSERRARRRLVRLLGPGLLAVAVLVLAASPAVSSPPPPPNPVPGGSLDPTTIPKYKEPLVIPPAMPRTQVLNEKGKQIDYYEIAVKQFEQYILPQAWSEEHDIDPTTVWSYASMLDPRPAARGWHAELPGPDDRGAEGQTGPRQVDQRPRRRRGALPAPPLRRRPDPALGQPAGRPGRDRLARHGRRCRTPGPCPS